VKLRHWLLSQEANIAGRWYLELTSGVPGEEGIGAGLLKSLTTQMASFLPFCFGERRDRGLEVWNQASNLYGSVAVRRGLAAGEVVEELQLLRNVVLRLLLVEARPGVAGGDDPDGIPALELLTLNRVLDLAVSRATIAYTDDLFFAHLQGSGIPEGVTEELAEEMERQFEAFRRELEA
jgi:hypothetical protein